MHKKIIVAAVVGLILGSLSTYGVCRWQSPGDGGAAEHHVAELERQLTESQDAARRASERADALAERNELAVDAIADIATGLADAAVRADRMGDLIDAIIANVGELERVYLGLAGIPAP